ncbi:hypothetical protein BCV69DRAFT_282296 [Microstroma glucosiphilum]|uniref:Uncharacterized protein n=1 Tax=Pseudomicrostroma glucosiphilum TaxID=1684307 RepID=A0A316U8K6_9BASI|nr:hypothetical protein BCV69DRAFT_282296 [Pseudomicrostroma glucosiphilum]PWN21577.1 hypothetical protein BCV69DRAFT_282296 [Pseudomicrostroma glucosiphilum]
MWANTLSSSPTNVKPPLAAASCSAATNAFGSGRTRPDESHMLSQLLRIEIQGAKACSLSSRVFMQMHTIRHTSTGTALSADVFAFRHTGTDTAFSADAFAFPSGSEVLKLRSLNTRRRDREECIHKATRPAGAKTDRQKGKESRR